jgi:hypothetical protein
MRHDATLNTLSTVHAVDHPLVHEVRIWPTSHEQRFAILYFFFNGRVANQNIPEFDEYCERVCDWWVLAKGVPMHKVESFIETYKCDRVVRTRANKQGL